MPWKGQKDVYKVWVSEIILQQTRVEQGLKYYECFIKTFPTLEALAKAKDEEVFKLWEGLGYYSRCRNLVSTARFICEKLKGKFPESFEEIKKLKGIGPYTAAAISSFVFNEPQAVVDGNVYRVLARIFFVKKPIDTTDGKKFFLKLANKLLDKKQPGIYNQAIMDFGATICKPVPLCSQCFFNQVCKAYLKNKIFELPVKEKKTRISKRWFYFFVLQVKEKIAVEQRTEKDIWQQLYQFPLIEADHEMEIKEILKLAEKKDFLPPARYQLVKTSQQLKQQLSHQLILGKFITLSLKKKPVIKNLLWVTKKEMESLAFPKIINEFIKIGL